jgi:hypothetical protein
VWLLVVDLVADTLQEVLQATRHGSSRIRRKHRLLFSFLDHTGLSL